MDGRHSFYLQSELKSVQFTWTPKNIAIWAFIDCSFVNVR